MIGEPQAAELHIWHGIVLSTWAGAKGGLGALGLVKQAKAELEKAIELDPAALDGSAYTSLASLYYQVPGWPIGFGDEDKAEALFKQALALNPDGIDPNYFHGDFLLRQKRYGERRPRCRRPSPHPIAPAVKWPMPAAARKPARCWPGSRKSWNKPRRRR